MASNFEWDAEKERLNIRNHMLSFGEAQLAFLDPHRIILEDLTHSQKEQRYYCIGKVGEGIATVRFTVRGPVLRIIGAGYWRKGRRIYEEENHL